MRPKLKSDLDKVLELLPRLDTDGLREVDRVLKAISQFNKIEYQEQVEDYLLSGIVHEIQSRGLSETIPPFFRIKNRASFNAYGRKSEAVRALFDKHYPDLTLVEKAAFGRLCARSLAEYMESWNVPRIIEFTSLLSNVERIPAALDDAFPGYLGGGALRVIVRALSNPVVAAAVDGYDDSDADFADFDC